MDGKAFTYPFCYVPTPGIRAAADRLIEKIAANPELDALFSEGKMMGVMEVEDTDGAIQYIYAFSGLAGGRAVIGGFVPPIFDYTDPEGWFRRREAEISALGADRKVERAKMSAELQEWLFDKYMTRNAKGEQLSIAGIFARRGLVPPGGTGECAGPKLLHYALSNGLTPMAMGEFWYGASPEKEVREQGRFYPACTGKCGPLMSWQMEGLDVEPNPLDRGFSTGSEPKIIFEDDTLIVVDKPAGMLSVPGRVQAESLLEWLQGRFGEVHSAHRLDMDTSGVMVFARSLEAKVELERQFAGREVEKTYRARLVPPTQGSAQTRNLRKGAHGTIALPLALDYYDRPRQVIDEAGKPAVTLYEVLEVLPNGEIEVRFTPKTGRSHQLRVHAAHERGLGRPIKGDRLYGCPDAGRLFLHAETITFKHPVTGERIAFISRGEF